MKRNMMPSTDCASEDSILEVLGNLPERSMLERIVNLFQVDDLGRAAGSVEALGAQHLAVRKNDEVLLVYFRFDGIFLTRPIELDSVHL